MIKKILTAIFIMIIAIVTYVFISYGYDNTINCLEYGKNIINCLNIQDDYDIIDYEN
jgi:hypothetical protein